MLFVCHALCGAGSDLSASAVLYAHDRYCRGLGRVLVLILHRIGWSQVLSSTAQRAAAAEILNRVREEVATRNAMHARGA